MQTSPLVPDDDTGPTAGSPTLRLVVPSTQPDDLELVQRARAGEKQAFRQLVERHQGRVLRLAIRILGDEDEARDAVQDALLKAWTRLAGFEERAGFGTWLHRIVVNQCIDRKRRARARRRMERTRCEPLDLADEQAPPPEVAGVRFAAAAELMRTELRREIGIAIEKLSETSRRTLLLRDVDGLAYAEIAQTLDIPVGTVMSRLYYARQRLRALLVEAGLGEVVPVRRKRRRARASRLGN